MAIRSDDITQIIKAAIDEFDMGVETRSVGTVVEVALDATPRLVAGRHQAGLGAA